MKICADTSVFGGAFDHRFAEPSRKFFDEVSAGRYELAVSVIMREEIKDAPANVRDFYHAKIGEVEIFVFCPKRKIFRKRISTPALSPPNRPPMRGMWRWRPSSTAE